MRKDGKDLLLDVEFEVEVSMSNRIWEEILFLSKEVLPDELSGLGKVRVEDDHKLVVYDWLLFPQRCSTTHSTLDGEAIAKYIHEHDESEELKFWWHSHGRMGAFWSGTDESTIRALVSSGGWFLSLVLNTSQEYKLRLDVDEGYGRLKVDNLKLSFSSELSERRQEQLRKMVRKLQLSPREVDEEPRRRWALREWRGESEWWRNRCQECFYYSTGRSLTGLCTNSESVRDTHRRPTAPACSQFLPRESKVGEFKTRSEQQKVVETLTKKLQSDDVKGEAKKKVKSEKSKKWERETCGTCRYFNEREKPHCERMGTLFHEAMARGETLEPGDIYAGAAACHLWKRKKK